MLKETLVKIKLTRTIHKISASTKIIILIALHLIFIFINVYYLYEFTKITEFDAKTINEVGYIRGSIQKIIKLETNDISADQDIDKIDKYMTIYLHIENPDKFLKELQQLKNHWEEIKIIIYDYRTSKDIETKKKFIIKSEDIWNYANNTVFIAQIGAEEKHLLFSKIYYILAIDFLLVLFILYIIYTIIKLKMEEQSRLDSLTKVFNRHVYYEEMKIEMSRSNRYNIPLSLILLDIDFFKKINDTYGHDRGDMVLIKLSNLIKLNIREEDTFCRIGGEEFIIIAPNINSEDAINFAEKLRRIVQEYDFGTVGEVTISIGVSTQNKNDTGETLFKKVDEAVYISKNNGRNKVSFI